MMGENETWDYAVTSKLVALSNSAMGVTINSFAFGRLAIGDIVYMELTSIKYPNMVMSAVRQIAKRSRTMVIAVPTAWGFKLGDVVSIRMRVIEAKAEQLRATMAVLAPKALAELDGTPFAANSEQDDQDIDGESNGADSGSRLKIR